MKWFILGSIVAASAVVATPSQAADTCKLTPKEVVTRFMTTFYVDKKVREAFETWVVPGYIQHNPLAQNGRDAAIQFLEPYFAKNPAISYSINRIIADGNLVAVHSHGVFMAGSPGNANNNNQHNKKKKVVEH